MLAKANHATALSECQWQYGSNAKMKLPYGTVVSVDSVQSANKRATTLITADYEFGGGTIKRQLLNLRAEKLAE